MIRDNNKKNSVIEEDGSIEERKPDRRFSSFFTGLVISLSDSGKKLLRKRIRFFVLERALTSGLFDFISKAHFQLFLELNRLAPNEHRFTSLTTMAMIKDNPTDMDYTHATLPNSGNSTPERTIGPSTCAQLEATKADIRRYTLIAQGFENMLTTLRHSNAQDEDDPTYVESEAKDIL
ncbi:hypothetical protein TNIN_461241 [Trichonephila inaurata madagascariensis]|uniref:Uncharacterized protein n=1 Tax=Trichonephila inaurata madagascariensis TaxID=2747483 RepID=A0A8X6XYM7_9ARAC|nr:hypothetical protein TNIN_461241 [Trichonephila inaurata madagascariensis]